MNNLFTVVRTVINNDVEKNGKIVNLIRTKTCCYWLVAKRSHAKRLKSEELREYKRLLEQYELIIST